MYVIPRVSELSNSMSSVAQSFLVWGKESLDQAPYRDLSWVGAPEGLDPAVEDACRDISFMACSVSVFPRGRRLKVSLQASSTASQCYGSLSRRPLNLRPSFL